MTLGGGPLSGGLLRACPATANNGCRAAVVEGGAVAVRGILNRAVTGTQPLKPLTQAVPTPGKRQTRAVPHRASPRTCPFDLRCRSDGGGSRHRGATSTNGSGSRGTRGGDCVQVLQPAHSCGAVRNLQATRRVQEHTHSAPVMTNKRPARLAAVAWVAPAMRSMASSGVTSVCAPAQAKQVGFDWLAVRSSGWNGAWLWCSATDQLAPL